MSEQLLNVHELQTVRTKVVTIASGAKTANGNTQATPINVRQFKEANFFLDVTAIAGTTKQFTPTVYTKDPVSGKWFSLVAFTQATDVTSEMKVVAANLGEYISIAWIKHADTTSITFTLSAVLKV